MSCNPFFSHGCAITYLFYLRLLSQTASVNMKEVANKTLIGWLAVAYEALADHCSCQLLEYH